jgi:hypothetical protein
MNTVIHFFPRPVWQFAAYIILAVCSITVLLSPSVSAHTLKADGMISAVLHFQPDDDPMSNKPSEYILFLNDSTKRFSLGDCDCTISIKKDGKTISTSPMQLNTQGVIGGSITFAEAGAYEVIFEGSPHNKDEFQPFTLKYLEQVAPNPDTGRPSLSFYLGISVVVVIMLVIALVIKVRYNSLEGVKK